MKNALLLLILTTLSSCGPSHQKNRDDILISETTIDSVSAIQSVKHDGHLFIVYDGFHSGNIIHHPDCSCQKTK